MTRWILVCDASRAILLSQRSRQDPYELVGRFEHQDSRARVRDLVSDATGRKPVGVPLGGSYGGRSVSLGFGRPGVAPSTDPKDVEAQKFARRLRGVLEAGVRQDAYDTLVIVAPPKFLGLLRRIASDAVIAHLEAEIPKDLAGVEGKQLTAHLQRELGGA